VLLGKGAGFDGINKVQAPFQQHLLTAKKGGGETRFEAITWSGETDALERGII